jgi:hypothetical protein
MQFQSKSITYNELLKLAEQYPPLSHEEQERLAAIAAGGDKEAQELLFKHNAQRIIFFAQFFSPEFAEAPENTKLPWRMRLMAKWKKCAPKTITTDDIISAALLGLWRAISTYDPTRGKFNHHANVLIWQEIQSLRQKEELRAKRERPWDIQPSAGEGPIWPEPTIFEDELEDFNTVIARVMLDWYAQKYLEPEAYRRFCAMLSGDEPMDKRFLQKVGKTLQEKVPEADWVFMAEHLMGP